MIYAQTKALAACLVGLLCACSIPEYRGGYSTEVYAQASAVWSIGAAAVARYPGAQVEASSRSATIPLPLDNIRVDNVRVKIEEAQEHTLLLVTSNRPENSARIMRDLLSEMERSSVAYDPVDYGQVGEPK